MHFPYEGASLRPFPRWNQPHRLTLLNAQSRCQAFSKNIERCSELSFWDQESIRSVCHVLSGRRWKLQRASVWGNRQRLVSLAECRNLCGEFVWMIPLRETMLFLEEKETEVDAWLVVENRWRETPLNGR